MGKMDQEVMSVDHLRQSVRHDIEVVREAPVVVHLRRGVEIGGDQRQSREKQRQKGEAPVPPRGPAPHQKNHEPATQPGAKKPGPGQKRVLNEKPFGKQPGGRHALQRRMRTINERREAPEKKQPGDAHRQTKDQGQERPLQPAHEKPGEEMA